MTFQAWLAVVLAAQAVTITRPGAPPQTTDCSVVPGCIITVTPAPVVEPPPPPPCTFALDTSALALPASSDILVHEIRVTPSREGCEWSAESSAAWLRVTPTSDLFPASVLVFYEVNTSTVVRTATVTVAGIAVPVTQAAAAPPPPPPPPTGTLWRLDLTDPRTDSNRRRLYGLSSRRVSGSVATYFTESITSGAAPGGGDALRFTMLPYQGQRYIGGTVETGALGRTETRTIRGQIRYHMGRRSAIHTQKLIIVGDASGGNRPILTIGTHCGEPNLITMDLQIDGGARRIASPCLPTDTWISWEVAISGSGSFSLTVNGRLAGTASGLNFSDAQLRVLGQISLGYYMNDSVAANDDFWFELADVVVLR